MNNNDNKELLNKYKIYVAISKFQSYKRTNKYPRKSLLKKWRYFNMKKRVIATICTSIVLLSGVAFATNYNKIVETFSLGRGIDTAVQDGYIANPNMDYVNSNSTATDETTGIMLNNIKVNAKIEDFLMDDLNISTHFTFEIDTKINKTFDLDTLHNIELKDLIVTDEENKILYCMNQEVIENYCKKNNINRETLEDSDNYYNCGLNTVLQRHDKENGLIYFTYNMYSGYESFPKSKKLNFKFTQIQLKSEEEDDKSRVVNLKGNWNIDVDVPEKMYNRKSISYKVVSCENQDFQVTAATLTETGFEFGMIVSNIEQPEEPQILKDLRKDVSDGKMDNDEMNRKLNKDEKVRKAFWEWLKQRAPVTVSDYEEGIENVTYVENEKGEKFASTMSPSRRQDGNFIDGNKYSFYETFDLTTSTATDKLKVRVLYKDKPYIVELERVYN